MNNQLTTTVLNNNLTMSSVEIAELTGKIHKNVLVDIRKMFDELEIDSAEFSAQYKDGSGKSNVMFNLDRDLTDCLLTGYSAILRMKVIKRWKELERQQQFQLPQTKAEALRALADSEEEKERLQLQLAKTEREKHVLAVENADLFFDGSKAVNQLISSIEDYESFINDKCDSIAKAVADAFKPEFYGEARCSSIGVNRALEAIGFIQRSPDGSIRICRQVVMTNIGNHEHDGYPVWNINALKRCEPFREALEAYINKELK
ncbi:Rha family transcriptional regulator [Vibrio agarivorans]|uniref:Rha family transcriptional regulator n=1 Tax=Vibrio agarivorans TaxID=153622 RepID=UPI0025B385B2|nr:Rha family transcriptional regulator [Vibrio agarivorans]MDN3659951.1 Rha family transcriptional regulator [Vibrio agarivorans]